ncbi:MAG: hydantoinase/oxoprolinase family protein, partial [Aromatoleum sp.]|nr:hydantoinase/oxoprolinase family protein [Aromatoleum sp.]
AALNLSVEQAAESAIRLANANIVRAIQLVSTERGRDPRDYVIVPFGGAGPLHATMIAADLGVDSVVVPPNPGVISAYGLLASDYVKHESLTLKLRLDEEAPARVGRGFDALCESLLLQFREMGFEPPLEWTFGVDMRFVGQAFEVTVGFDADAIAKLTREDMERRFVDEHHRVFFHGEASNRVVEIICLRLAACKRLAEIPKLARDTSETGAIAEAPLFADGRWGACTRLAAGSLGPGQTVEGPALLQGLTATILVSAGWRGTLDGQDNLVVTRG